MLLGLLATFTALGIMRSSNEHISGSLVQVLKVLEAIQTSWDLDSMILQEYGGFITIMEHFALQDHIFAYIHHNHDSARFCSASLV